MNNNSFEELLRLRESFEESSNSLQYLAKINLWKSGAKWVKRVDRFLGERKKTFVCAFKALYLYQVKNLASLNFFPCVLVLDGAILLDYFFKNYPGPMGIRTKFLIHREHEYLVPSEWLNHVAFYSIKHTPSIEAAQAARKLAIISHSDENEIQDLSLQNTMTQVNEIFGNQIEPPEIFFSDSCLYTFPWQENFLRMNQFKFEFYRKLQIALSQQIQYSDPGRLNEQFGADWLVVETNHSLIFRSYDLNLHTVLASGAQVLGNFLQEDGSRDAEMALSPFHSLQIWCDPSSNRKQKREKYLDLNACSSNENGRKEHYSPFRYEHARPILEKNLAPT